MCSIIISVTLHLMAVLTTVLIVRYHYVVKSVHTRHCHDNIS